MTLIFRSMRMRVLRFGGPADDWQLIMWLLAVGTFYYQMRISLNKASETERERYERHMEAMLGHVDFGKALLAFPEVPEELRLEALQKQLSILESITAALRPDVM